MSEKQQRCVNIFEEERGFSGTGGKGVAFRRMSFSAFSRAILSAEPAGGGCFVCGGLCWRVLQGVRGVLAVCHGDCRSPLSAARSYSLSACDLLSVWGRFVCGGFRQAWAFGALRLCWVLWSGARRIFSVAPVCVTCPVWEACFVRAWYAVSLVSGRSGNGAPRGGQARPTRLPIRHMATVNRGGLAS